jgi:hypothetical protein
MKLYLAHPIKARHDIRNQELACEQATGIELINPFYDPKGPTEEREDIKSLDSATRTAWAEELNYIKIVEDDIHTIERPDVAGTVVWVEKTVNTLGTSMEAWHTFQIGKIVYIISPDWFNHPWLRYIAAKSGGAVFKSFGEFTEYIQANYDLSQRSN